MVIVKLLNNMNGLNMKFILVIMDRSGFVRNRKGSIKNVQIILSININFIYKCFSTVENF